MDLYRTVLPKNGCFFRAAEHNLLLDANNTVAATGQEPRVKRVEPPDSWRPEVSTGWTLNLSMIQNADFFLYPGAIRCYHML